MSAPGWALPAHPTLRVQTVSDWHVGSGRGTPSGVNAVVRRDRDGLPYLPGTTLTGVLRDACEQVADGLDGDADGARRWGEWARHLFGHRATDLATVAPARSVVAIRAARASQPLRVAIGQRSALLAATTFVKPGVAIDADTGRADDHAVRFVEMARAGVTLVAPVDLSDARRACAGRSDGHDDPTGPGWLAASALLVLGCAWLRRLGADRRRGAGAVALTLTWAHAPDWPALVEAAASWAATNTPPRVPTPVARETALAFSGAGPAIPDAAGRRWLEVPLAVTVLDPLRLPRETLGNIVYGHDHVPGTAMLAWALARLRAPEALRAALTVGDALVTNLVPEFGGRPGHRAPMGLGRTKNAAATTPLRGLLAGPAPITPGDPTVRPLRGGWITWAPGEQPRAGVHDLHTEFITHNVVTKHSGRPTEDDGGVYTVEVVPAGVRLRGALRLRASVADALTAALGADWYTKLGGRSRLGAAARSEYGQVEVARAAPVEIPRPPVAAGADTRSLTVWALSDVLVRDRRLRMSGQLTDVVAALATALGDGVALELVGSGPVPTTRVARIESWQRAWGLPRPSLIGLAAGSCLLVRVTQGQIDPDRLADVAAGGLGERRGEGFGQLALNAPVLTATEIVQTPTDDAVPPEPATGGVGPAPALDDADAAYFATLRQVAFRELADRRAADQVRAGTMGSGLVSALARVTPTQRGAVRDLAVALDAPGGLDRLRNTLSSRRLPDLARELTALWGAAGGAETTALDGLVDAVRVELDLPTAPESARADALTATVLAALAVVDADRRGRRTAPAEETPIVTAPGVGSAPAAAPADGAATRAGPISGVVSPRPARPARPTGKRPGAGGQPAGKRIRYRPARTRWELTATLVARTPVHVGGAHEDPLRAFAVARDGAGRPYVPGSSLAGVLRAWWGRRWPADQVRQVWDGLARLAEPDQPQPGQPQPDHGALASLVEVADAPLEAPGGGAGRLTVRDGVGIDRYTGSAAYRVKYERQVVAAGTRVRLRVFVDDPDPADTSPRAAELRALTDDLDAYGLTLGAGVSRGLGRLAVEPGSVTLTSVRLDDPASLLAAVRALVDPPVRGGTAARRTRPVADPGPAPGILRIRLDWRPDGPLLVGAALPGERAALLPLLDAHPDTDGPVPVLPGSSVKGVLRSEVERAARTVLGAAGGRDRPDLNATLRDLADRCPPLGVLFGTQERRAALAIPDTFAAPDNAGTWRQWQQYTAGDATSPPARWARESTHVAIDRWTGGAADQRLYTVLEPHGLRWNPIHLDIDLVTLQKGLGSTGTGAGPLTAALVALLYALAGLVAGTVPLGRGGGRGLGAVRIDGIGFELGPRRPEEITLPAGWVNGNLARLTWPADATAATRRAAVLTVARDVCRAAGIPSSTWTDHLAPAPSDGVLEGSATP